MTEKTTFREHIAQSGGVCPQHSPGIPDERGELPSQRAEVFVERPLLGALTEGWKGEGRGSERPEAEVEPRTSRDEEGQVSVRDQRRGLCASCQEQVSEPFQADGGRPCLRRARGDRDDPTTRRGLRAGEACSRRAAERRQADADAWASGLQGHAWLGDVLPRVYGEMVEGQAWRAAY